MERTCPYNGSYYIYDAPGHERYKCGQRGFICELCKQDREDERVKMLADALREFGANIPVG